MPRFITIGGSAVSHIEFADGRTISPQYAGNAQYSAAGMLIWSESVGVVTSVGSAYPQEGFDLLKEAGMDISGVHRRDSDREFETRIIYDEDGKRVYEPPGGVMGFLQNKAPALLSLIAGPMWRSLVPQAEDIPPEFLKAEGALVCSSEYQSQAKIVEALQGQAGKIVLDTPTLVLQPHGTIPKGLADLSIPDYIIPSEAELFEYFGDGISPLEGVNRLKELGARNVVVKLGEKGSMVFDEKSQNWHTIPVFKTQVVDPTGAGDAYGGGFLVGLVETGSPVQAALYGTVSASFIIERLGWEDTLKIDRGQAEERLEILRSQIN